MSDYKVALGILATTIGFIAYVPYFRDIFKRKTKPHAFTWFIWGLLTAIAFFAQVAKHGGAGTWITGSTALICFLVAALALPYGVRKIALIDWVSLAGAFSGLLLWVFTKDPLLAVIFICVVDIMGYVPTLRKGYSNPYEETASTFFLNALKFVIGMMALESFNLTTSLFPATLIFTNGSFVLTLLLRRRSLAAG